MRQHAGCLARLQAVVQRPPQVAGQLRRLARRNQDRDGHQTSIARRQLGPPPHIAEEHVVRQCREAGAIRCCSGPDGLPAT